MRSRSATTEAFSVKGGRLRLAPDLRFTTLAGHPDSMVRLNSAIWSSLALLLLAGSLGCESTAEPEPSEDVGSRFEIHPYLGYTYAPGRDGINRHGFDAGGREYPYARAADEFVVGVFGGSAALQVAKQARQIEQMLLPVVEAQGYGRITVLPFAVEGWRQPQTFHAFVTYLPTIDMALVIDGYGEVVEFADATIEGWPGDYPSAKIYGALSGISRGLAEGTPSERAEEYFGGWEDRIRLMDLIGLERGKPVVHFIEPNPYGGPEHEARPEGAVAAPAYRMVREMTERLSDDGVSSTFLGDALTGAAEPRFTDECCDLNDDGAAQLTSIVTQEIGLSGQMEEATSARERRLPKPRMAGGSGLQLPLLGSAQ